MLVLQLLVWLGACDISWCFELVTGNSNLDQWLSCLLPHCDPSGKLISGFAHNHILSGNLQTISNPSSSPSTSFTDGSCLPLNQRNQLHRNILTSLAQQSIHHSNRWWWIHHVHFSSLVKWKFWNGVSFTWAPHMLFWRVKSNLKYTRILGSDLELGWKVQEVGRWSVHMVGHCARGTGFVMFWDWESGDIVRRVDVEAKNVGFLWFLSPCSVQFNFFCLGFLV